MLTELHGTKPQPSTIYPEATRHLPGNASNAQLPTLTGLQPDIISGANKRVHERVQSLRFYTVFTLTYSLCAILAYTLWGHSLDEGALVVSIPESLQQVGAVAAVFSVMSAPALLLSKKVRRIKGALVLQLIGFTAVFLTAFAFIVTDFVNFFFGVGLVAVIQVFLGLWTRSVLRDVQELREI